MPQLHSNVYVDLEFKYDSFSNRTLAKVSCNVNGHGMSRSIENLSRFSFPSQCLIKFTCILKARGQVLDGSRRTDLQRSTIRKGGAVDHGVCEDTHTYIYIC